MRVKCDDLQRPAKEFDWSVQEGTNWWIRTMSSVWSLEQGVTKRPRTKASSSLAIMMLRLLRRSKTHLEWRCFLPWRMNSLKPPNVCAGTSCLWSLPDTFTEELATECL